MVELGTDGASGLGAAVIGPDTTTDDADAPHGGHPAGVPAPTFPNPGTPFPTAVR
ncbi:hypothetical protein [Streptomyces spinosisporus]|uniref:Uncharacterized protein n=1 Tax=Streptomyces spinosisporus TaxID=2927582 RepID=A0ABS9XFT3_9ACTN|nr:hypothetical protein [Streptomyces spinosisporus]MCI3240947.1 hypothetical protein [Streptomyces spinosisporus]